MNVLESSKERERERELEKKEREWELLECSWMKEKKKIKEGGDRDRTTCVEEKNKKKRNEMYGWNEMRQRRNNIKNKKS